MLTIVKNTVKIAAVAVIGFVFGLAGACTSSA